MNEKRVAKGESMIDLLRIKNFQSHKQTELEFCSGINVIVGSSDAGKTAIIRALKWLIHNRPQGKEFTSYWAQGTEVEIVVGEHSVKRLRQPSYNEYHLCVDCETQKFAALRTEVPPEISQLLNIDEVNLQQQFDHPFLLDDPPGAVAQHFNKVAHLDIIDRASTKIQSWIRNLNELISSDERLLVSSQESFKEYDYLDTLEVQITAVERLDDNLQSGLTKHHDLSDLLDKIKAVQAQIQQQDILIENEAPVLRALALYKDHRELQVRMRDLATKINAIEKTESSIESLSTQIVKLQTQFDEEFPQTCPLCGSPKEKKK